MADPDATREDDPDGADDARPESPTAKGRLKAIAGNLVLLVGSLVVALLVAEAAVRIVVPQQLILLRPDIWVPVDSLGWRHATNLDTRVNTGERTVRMRTDVEGFRTGAGGRSVADSILLLGDSFMAALQVEHESSLAGLIEDSLSVAGRSVAVRNTAVGAWDTPHYLLFGRSRLDRYRYPLLLVSVFVGNDVVGRRIEYFPPRPPAERARFRIPLSLSPAQWIDGIARPLNDALETRSHLFVFAKTRSQSLRIRLGLSADYVPWTIMRSRADDPAWEVTAGMLEELKGHADAASTPMLVVLVPAQYQVDDDLFASHSQAFGLETAALDLDQPNDLLREELRERGISVVDALPAFRQAHDDGVVLYGEVDTHLSPDGHLTLYRLLEDSIAQRMAGAG